MTCDLKAVPLDSLYGMAQGSGMHFLDSMAEGETCILSFSQLSCFGGFQISF